MHACKMASVILMNCMTNFAENTKIFIFFIYHICWCNLENLVLLESSFVANSAGLVSGTRLISWT